MTECLQCDVHFDSERDLREHRNDYVHNSTCCGECGKVFSTHNGLDSHRRAKNHTDVRCTCGTTFSTIRRMEQHCNTSSRHYVCETCRNVEDDHEGFVEVGHTYRVEISELNLTLLCRAAPGRNSYSIDR